MEDISNDMEKMWNEEIMAQFKLLSWHLPGQTKESHKDSQLGQLIPNQDSKYALLKQKPETSLLLLNVIVCSN
jgi:hypothetical protein